MGMERKGRFLKLICWFFAVVDITVTVTYPHNLSAYIYIGRSKPA